jgi:hypothetical protein
MTATVATCEWCGRRMDGAGCIVETYGRPFDGHPGARCRDCGMTTGGLHHPACTVAACWDACGDQAFGSEHVTAAGDV